MIYSHAGVIVAAILALTPLLLFGFAGDRCVALLGSQPLALRLLLPTACVIPYLLVCGPLHLLRAGWLALYLLLPPAVAALLFLAVKLDPEQHGHWLDFVVLLSLGLAVDLRWFEPAWPHGLAFMNKLLLLDAGLYGFNGVRALSGIGYDLKLRVSDPKTGLREWLFFTPIAVALGLALGFLHWHHHIDHPWTVPLAWLFTFFLIALPEEIYFRGWMQNLLERKVEQIIDSRLARTASLLITAVVFGLSHFNKRAAVFNWRYVLLAAIAGIFYGRAWRAERRIAASAITHATVDTLWGALLR